MEIKTKITVNCDSGFYCMRNGIIKCLRISKMDDRQYCALFDLFLDTDSKGNVLKCEKCLLAEREARKEM
jgi:hypothetical protein